MYQALGGQERNASRQYTYLRNKVENNQCREMIEYLPQPPASVDVASTANLCINSEDMAPGMRGTGYLAPRILRLYVSLASWFPR